MIIVIGDFILDKYVNGSVDRISPEAPVPVLKVKSTDYKAGGAGNVALNLQALGAEVALFTILGDDAELEEIALQCLNKIPTYFVTDTRKCFATKTRLVAGNQQIARYDHEDNFPIKNEDADYLILKFTEYCKLADKIDAIIFSDYNKGVFTDYFITKVKEVAKLLNIKIFVDPKQGLKQYEKTYLITPNIKEASSLFQFEIKNEQDVTKNLDVIKRLLTLYQIQNVVITLGDRGAYLISENDSHHFDTKKINVFDVTGAGDTFLAALVFDHLRNKDLRKAIPFANLAASISVSKRGTATVTYQEIQQSVSKVFELSDLVQHVKYLKEKSQKVVFTNGVFDILHTGHMSLLNQAKANGDYLIVAINSDESVRKLKGPNRPIFNQNQRAQMLSSLAQVDAVVIFSESTPFEILQALRPNILVKGADYKMEDIVGKEFVDQTVRATIVPDQSTSNTIERLNQEIENLTSQLSEATFELEKRKKKKVNATTN